MLYCEDCRIYNNLKLPPSYPYVDIFKATCELCHKMKDCYDIPAIYAKHRYNWTTEEKILDTMLQKEYRGKAEEMIIPITKGKHAGAVNHEYTDMLLGVLVQVEGQIDWFATYEMRRKLRDAIVKKQKGG